MIVPPTSVRVLVATKPVDFRKGMDGLAAFVQEELKADPFSGIIYVFRAKRCRPREAAVLGRDRPVPAHASGWKEANFRWPRDRGRRDAAVARAALGASRLSM